jgi:hypothetical protein
MDRLRRWTLSLLFVLAASLPLVGATSAQEPPAAAAAPVQPSPFRAWWADQSWRYATGAAAEQAYRALVARESPWPEWHQPTIVTLPAGLRFQMALSPGQGTDRPGGFGTFDLIPNVAYVRIRLAVKQAWKPAIDRVVTYEVTDPIPADTGTVGPQIDAAGPAYLPGGGSQLEMKVPAPDRIRHLKVVEVRAIS